MSTQTKRVILRVILFGLFGLLLEVFFTAGHALSKGHWTMHGFTSPWMMIDYGLFGIVLAPVASRLKSAHIALPFRAIIYMLMIFAVEFISGWLFDIAGLKIWDYSQMPYTLCGYITALYIPFWYGLGLVAEGLYRKIDAISLTLALNVSTENIEQIK